MGHLLLEMDSRTFERTLPTNPLVIVPVGALEAHGPHLPLGADQIQAEATAAALAERLHALVAPTIPYGVCAGSRPFPGTVSLSMSALGSYVRELLSELARLGVRRILLLSGHAAPTHMAALREAADAAVAGHPGLAILVLSDYEFVYELRGKEAPASDGHAGLLETSRVLAMAPQTVGKERPVIQFEGSRFKAGEPTPKEWPESVMGDTRASSAALGERVQRHVIERLVASVETHLPR
jgi:creatinine amidohydrolase